LLSAIKKIGNKNIRELLVTSFSSSIEYHNLLCQYNYGKKHIINSFNYHAYPITMMPVENNVWGAKVGAGTFDSYIEL
jgi:adenine-specific DNA methylase